MHNSPMQELDDAVAGWLDYAASIADWNPSGVRVALRVADALRLEQHDGTPRCTCCLQPFSAHGYIRS